MYQLDWLQRIRSGKPLRIKVSPTVWYLGFTSFLTDISSEMVSSTLPMYLVLQLGLSPLQFGFLDGLYQGVTALLRIVSGFLADRWRRYKEVAAAGYGLSAVCKLGLLLAGNAWVALAGIVTLDRIGKGVRTAPRDALISLSSEPANLATAFGVHRALDAGGAMAGPLVAFLVLSLVAEAFDSLFVVSFCVAVIGLGVLILFVENKAAGTKTVARSSGLSLIAALGLLSHGRFRTLVVTGGCLSLATMSDSFVYLGIQQQMKLNGSLFPLLYFGTALFYVLFAVPTGRLADRVGRGVVFIAGHVFLLAVYTAPLLPHFGVISLLCYLGMFGIYFAATEGVLMAMTAAVLPPELCTSGMALLTTVTSLSRLLASVLLGWLWTQGGSTTAAEVFLAALIGGILFSTRMLDLRRRS